jgi:DNA polymerase-3 subunit alpha
MRQDAGLDSQKLVQLIEEAVSQERKESSLLISYLQECQQFGIDVLPLDINKSLAGCALENEHAIRIGFSLLVSKEEQFLEDIRIERQQHGLFCSFQDFCERINLDLVP